MIRSEKPFIPSDLTRLCCSIIDYWYYHRHISILPIKDLTGIYHAQTTEFAPIQTIPNNLMDIAKFLILDASPQLSPMKSLVYPKYSTRVF